MIKELQFRRFRAQIDDFILDFQPVGANSRANLAAQFQVRKEQSAFLYPAGNGDGEGRFLLDFHREIMGWLISNTPV
ncbi:hypothetical protein HRbin36_01169 [bacterium HR36]|nr:hypothetical protein HRbin36_01169 [bacterium HR36]